MKILLISQYFWPESFIINDLVKCIVTQGHTVEVLTGKPNYPDGAIFNGYSAAGCTTDYLDDIPVHRVPLFPRGKGGALRLAFNYLSFVLSGLLYFHRFIKRKEFDVIFVFAPSPITSVIPAIYLKKRLKIPLALWVQDLWPESLNATGFIRNKFILRSIGRLVKKIYTPVDLLLVQSKAFFKPIAKYAAEEKILYYPNSYLEIQRDRQSDVIPEVLQVMLDTHRCFVFAGNLGTAQSVETIVQAAEQLKHLPDCRLVLVGSGSMLGWIEQEKKRKGLDNLILAGRFPGSSMPCIFSRAAALLVTLKKNEIFAYTIPSKIQAYLAAGRPILAALDGEGGRIIQEAGAGFSSPAEDGMALAKNIELLYYMSELNRDKLGQSGRAYFLEHFEMISQSRRLIEIFEEQIRDVQIVLSPEKGTNQSRF